MRQLQEIAVTEQDKYEVLLWNNTPIYTQYERLISYLKSRNMHGVSDIFAKPDYSPKTQCQVIRWYTDAFHNQYTKLSDLNGEEYSKYRAILNETLNDLELLSENVTGSSGNAWPYMIHYASQFIREEFIFCADYKIVVAAWGLKSRLSENINNNPTYFEIEPQSRTTETVNNETHNECEYENILNNNDHSSVKQEDLYTSDGSDSASKNSERDSTLNCKKKSKNRIVTHTSLTSPSKVLKFIAPLLFVITALLTFTMCSPSVNEKRDKKSLSNDIKPVNPENLDIGEDSLVTVAGNRLNIIIQSGNKDINVFVKAFKEAYPENSYKVIYYDSLTNRIQIQVPQKDRIKVKNNLSNKLLQYDLLIWEENYYKKNKMPADPGFKSSLQSWYFNPINIEGAWKHTFGDEKIKIAVIDNGFDLSHAELEDQYIKPYNSVLKNNDVFTNKDSRHGTHVAGTIIAERNNKMGLSGIAPDCKIIPIQVADKHGLISSTALIDAVLYAIKNDADIINMSLGLLIDPVVGKLPLRIQKDLINHSYKAQEKFWNQLFSMAEKNGTSIVLAGGNSNMIIGIDARQRHPLGIKVNALSEQLNKARFSNYGSLSTVSAPGVNIYSSTPNNNFESLDGTSMAAPIVSGGVALLKSLNKDISTQEIISILQKTGKEISNKNGYVGPLIQLNRAVEYLIDKDGKTVFNACTEIQAQIDQLYEKINQLKRRCPQYESIVRDTLRMPRTIKDKELTTGRWMSTTKITNDEGELVTLFFEFSESGTGKYLLIEPDGVKCDARLSLVMKDQELLINQDSRVDCTTSLKSYHTYTFKCTGDKDGNAICTAQNNEVTVNRFKFNMVKIK